MVEEIYINILLCRACFIHSISIRTGNKQYIHTSIAKPPKFHHSKIIVIPVYKLYFISILKLHAHTHTQYHFNDCIVINIYIYIRKESERDRV